MTNFTYRDTIASPTIVFEDNQCVIDQINEYLQHVNKKACSTNDIVSCKTRVINPPEDVYERPGNNQ